MSDLPVDVLTEALQRVHGLFDVLVGLLQASDLISEFRMIARQQLQRTHDRGVDDGEVVG